MTLVEVLIAASLGVVILALVGGMFITGLQLQNKVTTIDVANSQSEIVMATFRNQISRASALPQMSDDKSLVTVVVSDFAGSNPTVALQKHCVAWRLRDQAIQMATYPTSTDLRSEDDLHDDSGKNFWKNLTVPDAGQDSIRVTKFTVALSSSSGGSSYPLEVSLSVTPTSSAGRQEAPLELTNSFAPDSMNNISADPQRCELKD